ncbi:MAG: endolytic transglycosylase MltG [Chloroflexi bacterium]|nr:endolytic transglycosylase MltG [Chloroflexota bacterium]MBE3115559.1 endolytic transglycosylase MltG [Actinomycetota bacterium]
MKAVNNKFINKINLVIILLVIPLLLFYLVSCSLFKGAEKEEVTAGVEVEFEIKEGMTLKEIASLLEEKGIIDNAFLFRLFVEQRGKEKSLIPGIYTVETNSEYEKVLDRIVAGTPVVTYKFIIPEGYTVKQIIEMVAQEIPFIEYKDMEEAVDIGNYSYDYLKDAESLEGFLFPKTYEITIDYSARDIIEMMLAQYQFETGSLDYSFSEDKGFTRYDILKIASMIEKEAYIAEERGLISAVIHNRLDINMALGIDATLCYFLDKWDGNLTETDLETDTEYNTRLYAGLPPTPICNPGLASIEAALNPADVDFLYYVVDDPVRHTHHFSIDYEEHTRVQNNTN